MLLLLQECCCWYCQSATAAGVLVLQECCLCRSAAVAGVLLLLECCCCWSASSFSVFIQWKVMYRTCERRPETVSLKYCVLQWKINQGSICTMEWAAFISTFDLLYVCICTCVGNGSIRTFTNIFGNGVYYISRYVFNIGTYWNTLRMKWCFIYINIAIYIFFYHPSLFSGRGLFEKCYMILSTTQLILEYV